MGARVFDVSYSGVVRRSGAPPGSSIGSAPHLSLAAVVVVALASAGCGGAKDTRPAFTDPSTTMTTGPSLTQQSEPTAPAAPGQTRSDADSSLGPFVTDQDIATTPPSSARRAFLEQYRLLQWEAFESALTYYDRPLVNAIGAARMIEAFKSQLTSFQAGKPMLQPEIQADGQTIVRYETSDVAGRVAVHSVTWRRRGGEWRATYNPVLDGGLKDSAQKQTQAAVAPTAPQTVGAAISAGNRASQAQSRFVGAEYREAAVDSGSLSLP